MFAQVATVGLVGVVVVASVVGLNFFVNQQGIGAPTPNPLPTPTTEPSVDLGIFEPIAGWIAYHARDDISAADPNSTDPATTTTIQLTSELGEPLGWSLDGTRLLILRASNLYVLHADGTETLVTDQASGQGGGAISPDGSRVVFEGEDGFYAVDADGGPAERINEEDGGWAWTLSPDWTQIAYVQGRGDSDHRVWVMDFDGDNAHEIVANEATLGGGHVRGLAWSPAGDRIALALGGWVYTFAPDGSSFTRIAGAGGECHSAAECRDLSEAAAEEPYWSPDGSRIAFSTGCTGTDGSRNRVNCNLAIADADGSNLRVFGNAKSGPWHPGTPRNPTPSASPAYPTSTLTPATSPPQPPVTPPPSPFTKRFDSAVHGLSISYPAGWEPRPATEPWSHDQFTFGAADADVIFDPTLQSDLYISLVSEPLRDLSGEQWVSGVTADDICGLRRDGSVGTRTGDSYTIDGASGFATRRFSTSVVCVFAAVATATHGYVFGLLGEDEAHAKGFGWRWFQLVLDTVNLRPEDVINGE